MPPTTPVDSDIYKTTLYVVEDTKIWRAKNVGGGAATWEEVYNAAAYEALKTGASNTHFRRVVARGTVIYVMGYTQYAEQVGTSYYTAVCWRSLSAGTAWSFSGIAEFALASPNWFFDIEQVISPTVVDCTVTFEFDDKYTLHVFGEFTGAGFNILQYYPTIDPACDIQDGIPHNVKYTLTGTMPPGYDPNDPGPFYHTYTAIQWRAISWEKGAYLGDDTFEADGLNTGTITHQNFRITHSQNGAEFAGQFDYYLRIPRLTACQLPKIHRRRLMLA